MTPLNGTLLPGHKNGVQIASTAAIIGLLRTAAAERSPANWAALQIDSHSALVRSAWILLISLTA